LQIVSYGERYESPFGAVSADTVDSVVRKARSAERATGRSPARSSGALRAGGTPGVTGPSLRGYRAPKCSVAFAPNAILKHEGVSAIVTADIVRVPA